jgi:hypothetical protein
MKNVARNAGSRQDFPSSTNPTRKIVIVDGSPYEVHVLAPFRGRPKPEPMAIRHRGEPWQRWQRRMRGQQ